ncbi:Nipa protein 2, partial [Globisporangium splendens]
MMRHHPLLVFGCGVLFAAQMPHVTTALANVQKCSSCDVPSEAQIPFCAEFDNAAQEEYAKLLNESSTTASSAQNASCATALKHAECAKVFNVCELGAAQSFCRDSCASIIATNCSATLSATSLHDTQKQFCGDTSNPVVGVADGGKCFDADYVGPKHSAWVIGFTIAVVFSFFASVGINLQKKALKQNELTAQEQNTTPTPVYRLPLWCLGFFLILAGSVLDFVAFGLAPQSLLAPLAALTLVWNMMLAPCFNKEKLGRKDIAATLVIFTGATIAVVFASHASPSYNLSMLLELYRDPLTCAYFVVVFLCVALHYSLIHLVESLSLTSKHHRLIQVGPPAVWARVRLVAYSGLAGTMGGQSVLFAKSCAELLKAAFHGDTCLQHFETYVIAAALIGCLLCQIHYLNCGLVHYDALSVVPIYQAYWIISGVLGGVIYFQEIRTFSVHQALVFVLGIMTTIFGVVLLSKRKPHAPAHSKRKILERGYSFTSTDGAKADGHKPGHLPTVPELPVEVDGSTVELEGDDAASVASMATIVEHESEMSTGEESDDDSNGENAGGDESDEVSRQVIDNYLDMSATMGFTEILGALGFQSAQSQRGIFSRRISSRIPGENGSARPQRRSVDDIEVGMPSASRDANPRERVAKRRSITFTSFQNSKKDPPPV